jgi:hypothetical protein
MSEYNAPEELESKLSLIIRKPQEGKTFICITNIVEDTARNVHIVLTMNTLSAGMQFFCRMEEKVGSKNIVVFNSKRETAGNCLYAKTVDEVFRLLIQNPEIKVIVCCAHEKRIRNSIPQLFEFASDSITFRQSNRNFKIHIDEAHKYIPENRQTIRDYNALPIVDSIIGYSATPLNIWTQHDELDILFHKILIRDVDKELSIIRSPDYFGVKCCKFHIIEKEITNEVLLDTAKIFPDISLKILGRSGITDDKSRRFYGEKNHFDLGDELLLLSYLDYILPKLNIDPNRFSYHFAPAYSRKVTHYAMVELILKHYPQGNVIVMNGNGIELYRMNPINGSCRVKTSHEIDDRILEPSLMIQELIKEHRECPTFITGLTCVGMSVTLINENTGNFDSVIMAHHQYSDAKLYQLCRFLFNYMNWSPENKANIKTTQFYSLTESVMNTCLEYEENVERLSTDFSGKSCSFRETQGLDPVKLSEREVKKYALQGVEVKNNKIWKRFKVYEGNDEDEWRKAEEFYTSIMKKPLSGRSKPKKINDFYHCSTTKGVDKYTTTAINRLEKQNWHSTFQLTDSLVYSRIFVGYENVDDSSEYTIYIKYAELIDNENTHNVLNTYGNGKHRENESETSSISSDISDE